MLIHIFFIFLHCKNLNFIFVKSKVYCIYSTSKISMTLGADERLIEHVQLSWCMGHFFPHTNWFETMVTSIERIKCILFVCIQYFA